MKYLNILIISLCLVIPSVSWSTNAGGVYRVCKATGGAAVSLSCNPLDQSRVIAVSIHFAAAPTTAGFITITLNSVHGSAYDSVLYRIDPSLSSATSIMWNPCFLSMVQGDTIDISYANEDSVTYGIIVYYEI